MEADTEECDVCGDPHATDCCPQLGLEISDTVLTTRARATLPMNFVLLVNANKNTDVIATTHLPSRYSLGTYEAIKTTKRMGGPHDFALQITIKDCGAPVWLDTTDENQCNWLCLIAVATNLEEKNVMALQVGMEIIYMTTCDILAGEPLKVWYAPGYARKINRSPVPDGITKSMVELRNQPLEALTMENVADGCLPSNMDSTTHIQSAMSVIIIPSATDGATSPTKPSLLYLTQQEAEPGPDDPGPDPLDPPERKSMEVPIKKEATLQCGKGVYLCAHVGCALIFPTPESLQKHAADVHSTKPEHSDNLDTSTENLKDDTVQIDLTPIDVLEEVSEVQCEVFQDVSEESPLAILATPRNTHIKHSETADNHVCSQCEQTFNSVEELAVHVKKHIMKGNCDKLGQSQNNHKKKKNLAIKQEPDDAEVVEAEEVKPRKSSRSRINKMKDDPDFIYSYSLKKKRKIDENPSVNIKRENMTSSEDETRVDDVKAEREQVVKRQRGRPRKSPNVIVIDKEEKSTKVSKTVNIEAEGTADAAVGSHIYVDPRVTGTPLAESVTGSTGDLLESETAEPDQNGSSENISKETFIVIEQENLGEGNDDKMVSTNATSGEPEMVTGAGSGETNSETKPTESGETKQVDFTGSRNVSEAENGEESESTPSLKEGDGAEQMAPQESTITIDLDQLSQTVDEEALPYTIIEIIDADMQQGHSQEGHIRTDHGEYSLKVTRDATGSHFTSRGSVPSIVNLDNMDVITGESLSTEEGTAQLSSSKQRSQGVAIIDPDKKSYTCDTCGERRSLISMDELEAHLFDHAGIKKCNKCSAVYNTSNSHVCKEAEAEVIKPVGKSEESDDSPLEVTSKDGKWTCKICLRMFNRSSSFRKHMKLHISTIQCKQCNKLFGSEAEMDDHICVAEKSGAGMDKSIRDAEKGDKQIDIDKDDKPHFCEFCGACFKKRQYLVLHLAMHTKEHKCEKCDTSFARKEALMKHWVKCMPEKLAMKEVFACNACARVFTKELSLNNHIQARHLQEYKCEQCEKVFSSMFSQKRHKCKEEVDAAPLQCTMCPKTFTRTLYLKRHMALHNGEFACVLCQRRYCRKEELLKHMLECSATLQYEASGSIKCTVCNEMYTDVHAYRLHYQGHTHPYKCDNCNKPFLRPLALKTHKEKCKPYENDLIVCPICNKKFRTAVLLMRHKQVHEEKKYTCEHCHKKFRRIDYLNKHVCIDTDGLIVERTQDLKRSDLIKKDPAICPECGKTFLSVSNLNKHMLLHGERKEICEVCGKKFHLKIGLREHMKFVHTDQLQIECKVCGKRLKCRNSLYGHMSLYHSTVDTVYACEECGKVFRHKGNLTKHLLVHSDERQFTCSQCEKKFKFPEQLRRHELWHTTGPRFYCDLCDKGFVMEFEIKKHLNTVHGGLTYICSYCSMDCHHFHSMKRHLQRRHFDILDWQENASEFIRGLAVQTTTDSKRGGPQHKTRQTTEVKQQFRCGLCKVVFPNQTELFAHVDKDHRGRQQYQCCYCDYTERGEEGIRDHLDTHHKENSEWQGDPDSFIQGLQTNEIRLRSALRDLSTLKVESDVMKAIDIATCEGLDAQSFLVHSLTSPLSAPLSTSLSTSLTTSLATSLSTTEHDAMSSTSLSSATALLNAVGNTIDGQVLSLPLQDISEVTMDMTDDPSQVTDDDNFQEAFPGTQTILIQDGEIRTTATLSQEVLDALQSLSAQGALTGDQPTMITIGGSVDAIQGMPVSLGTTDVNDQGVITCILPVMDPKDGAENEKHIVQMLEEVKQEGAL